jgi:hypothetical protein
MELNLQSLATECYVTKTAFAEGDRIISNLVRQPDGEFIRIDLLESAEESLEIPGESLCRWTIIFEPKPPAENIEREVRLTAENLFIELTSAGEDQSSENRALVQFLAVMLERKRILRARGVSDDGLWKRYEHGPEKTTHLVPAGEISSESLRAIRDQLESVLGIPKADGVDDPSVKNNEVEHTDGHKL